METRRITVLGVRRSIRLDANTWKWLEQQSTMRRVSLSKYLTGLTPLVETMHGFSKFLQEYRAYEQAWLLAVHTSPPEYRM